MPENKGDTFIKLRKDKSYCLRIIYLSCYSYVKAAERISQEHKSSESIPFLKFNNRKPKTDHSKTLLNWRTKVQNSKINK